MRPIKDIPAMALTQPRWPVKAAGGLLAVVVLLLSPVASAAAVKLKLAYMSSDRSPAYLSLIKPFVDAINDDGRGLLKIDVYFSGKLNPNLARQPEVIADGTVDIGFVVLGVSSKWFPDAAAIELPGLFRNTREASFVHTRLVAKKALRGYDDFYVIGAVGTQPETIHSRKRIASLADLNGQKLRVNNPTSGTAMSKLGASSIVIPLNDTANAISRGTVDGAVVQLAQLADFGVGRLVSHHYLLPTGSAPLALVMNRKVFDSLSEPARQLIRDHSGEWLAARYAEISDALSQRVIERFRANPRRKVVVPSPQDLAAAERMFGTVAAAWAAESPRHRELMMQVKTELAELRSKETAK